MGNIPLNLHVDYTRRPAPPTAVPSSFGVRPKLAAARMGETVGALGEQVSDIATRYAAKNKHADLRADSMAFETELKAAETEAARAAAQTNDPTQIRRIWKKHSERVKKWISSDTEGVPNIRWGDQRKELISSADSLAKQFDLQAENRIYEVGVTNSNEKSLRVQRQAEIDGDRKKIAEAVQVRVENATLTQEQGISEREAAFARSDTLRLKNSIALIEGMEPEQAEEAADAMAEAMETQEEDGSWAAYEYVRTEADRKGFAKAAREAAAAAKSRAQNAEMQRQAQSNGSVVDFLIQNGRMPSHSERAEMELTEQTARALDSKQYSSISPALAPAEAAAIRADIYEADPHDDPAKQKQMDLILRMERLESPGIKALLKQDLTRRYDSEISATDEEAETAITETILNADFRVGFGDGMSEEQAETLAWRAVNAVNEYRQWVQQKNPSPAERLKYVNDPDGPIGQLKAAKSYEAFRRAAGEQTRLNFSRASLNDVQGAYLDEKSSLLPMIEN